MQAKAARNQPRSTWRRCLASATLCAIMIALVLGFVLTFARVVADSATYWHQDPGPAAWHFLR